MIPPDLLAEIRQYKAALIAFLENNAAEDTATRPVIARAGVQSSYPLSSSQRRLWVLSQMGEGNQAYTMAEAYRLEGPLERQALQDAFLDLIERHEVLRTVFREDAQGEVRQLVLPRVAFAIDYHEVHQQADPRAAVDELVGRQLSQPFDLAAGPLLRSGLYRTGAAQWVFVYLMHHIISDGWSMEVLLGEVLTLYHRRRAGEAGGLAELSLQYKDYALWQQQQLAGAALAAERAYWLGQLAGELPVMELPADRPRPVVKTYRGGSVSRCLAGEFTGRLKALFQGEGATLFMGLLAGVNALLYRYSGQGDQVIGSPVAGRQHGDLEGQIGLYLNTLALRSRFTGRHSFRQLLGLVREVSLGAFKHQQYPFDELVNELTLQRDTSRNALFDVMLILHNTLQVPAGAGRGPLRMSRYASGQGPASSKFDLTFSFGERDQQPHMPHPHMPQLEMQLEYNSDLFDASTAQSMLAHLEGLLEAALASPGQALDQLDYLPPAERQALLADYHQSRRDYPREQTLVELVGEQVQRTPLAPAVSDGQESYSYGQLWQRAQALSRGLLRVAREQKDLILTHEPDLTHELEEEQAGPVAVLLPRSAHLPADLLGVMMSGRAYIPLDATYPVERLNYILSQSGSRLLVVEGALPDGLHTKGLLVCPTSELLHLGRQQMDQQQMDQQEVDQQEVDQLQADQAQALPDASRAAYILYTSGSTGQPKGIRVGHRSVVNFLTSMQLAPGMGPADSLFAVTTYCFDISVLELFLPLVSGASLYVADQVCLSDPAILLDRLGQVRPSVLQATPAFLQMLFESGWPGDKQLKVLCGGEALSQPLAARLLEATHQVWNLYGPTETTVWSSLKQLHTPGQVNNTGRPIHNTQLLVLDAQQQLLPVGVAGEICIGGEGLALGYYRQPALTRERFVSHPYHPGERLYRTGDVGKRTAAGEVLLTGRLDHQVKVRGYRIELGEIESRLGHYPGLEQVVVVARPNQAHEKELIAYLTAGRPLSPAELRHYLAGHLPAYMLPSHFVQLPALPLTPNGKLDRKALPAPGQTDQNPQAGYQPPGNELEAQLVSLWEQVLEKGRVGLQDNFFDLGGNSLKLVRLARGLSELLQRDIPVPVLFQYATIKELLAYLNEEPQEEEEEFDRGRLISDMNKFNLNEYDY